MSAHTYTTSLYLAIDGAECERDVEISYEYSPAGGDGWNEPRYEAGATLCAAEVEYLAPGLKRKTIDLMPLLSKECISELESRCVQYEAERDEEARDAAADWKRDAMQEAA